MKVLISGSRYYKDKGKIYSVLSKLPKDTIIIHGGCKGADSLAGEVAKELNLDEIIYPAEWEKYGLSAGPRRNQLMLIDNPDLDQAFIFHEDLNASRGTKDMVERLNRNGIRYDCFT